MEEGNMKMKRGLKLLALVGVLSLIIAACGGDGGTEDTTATTGDGATTTAAPGTTEAPGTTAAGGTTVPAGELGTLEVAAGDPIKIASAQTISGDTASLGEDQVRAIEIAIADKGEILGHPIELAFDEDELCSSEGGQTAATRIIADPQVVAVIGTSCSGAGVPASNVITGAGRVLISGSNTSPVLTSDLAGNASPEYHEGYFRTAHNDAIQGAAAAKFVFEELGLTNVATVNDGDPYTQGLTQAFEGPFEELGGTIVVSTAVTADQQDMRPVLTEIAAAGAELIFFPIFQPAGDFIALQAQEVAGLEETVLMGADGLLSDTFVTLAQSENMYFSGPQTPTTDAYAEFVTKYEEAYGEPPIQAFHAHAYDATNMVFNAIEASATDDGSGNLSIDLQGLRDALFEMTHEGLTGTLDCDDFGDCASPNIDIVQNTEAEADIEAVRGNVLISYSREDLGL
jgi:branched-chain amino acid transport system substrate-binding protein